MSPFYDWLAQVFNKPTTHPSYARRVQLDSLESRQLLASAEPIDTLNVDQGVVDDDQVVVQSIVVVAPQTQSDPVLQVPATPQPMGPLTLEESGSGEGYGWVQGTGAGTGYVPGSVLASSGPLDWQEPGTTQTIDESGSGWGTYSSGSESGGTSGSGGSSGSGGGESSGSGSGGAYGSGSGGSAGSGSGGSSDSGSGGTSGSGSGSSSESGSGGSSGSGSGSSSGSGSGGSSGSGSGGSSGSGSGGSSGSGSGAPTGSGSGGTNAAPVIHNFAPSFNQGIYTFTGTVTDDQSPVGLVIIFGALLDGHSCIVNENGTFSYSTQIQYGQGEVTARTQDLLLAWSELEAVLI